jgi:allantoate deiminase
MTMTSSSALAGSFEAAALHGSDRNGVTLRAALAEFGGDPDRVVAEAYRPDEVIGYIEVHIEQGPVLEAANEPLAVVSAIAGQSRYQVAVRGVSGHAGTVPMALRRDALAAAAEMIMAVESTAQKARQPMVATVGEITARPGAVNVVPGEVAFSLDLRAGEDDTRREAANVLERSFAAIAERRKVSVTMTTVHEKAVTLASPRLKQIIADAIADLTGRPPREMMSGAGHDGQAMARLTDVGMIFVRCRGGISHNPDEYASPADIGLAIEALIGTITRMAAARRTAITDGRGAKSDPDGQMEG